MVLESGSRVQLAYVEETTRGTTPATPSLILLRTTSKGVNPSRNLLESDEFDASAQQVDVRHGSERVTGSFGMPIVIGDHSDIWRFAYRDPTTAWTLPTAVLSSTNITAPNQITRSDGGNFHDDDYRVGTLVTLAGWTDPANSGDWVVLANGGDVVDGTMTLGKTSSAQADLVTEAADTGHNIGGQGRQLQLATNLKTMTLERQFTGVSKYQPFRGVAINRANVSLQPGQLARATMDVIGMSSGPITGTSLDATPSPYDPATNWQAMSAFDGALWDGTTQLAVVTGLDFTIDHRRETTEVIGSKFSPDIFEGTTIISGTITALFEDETLFNKFYNEVDAKLILLMNDVGGSERACFSFPKVKYIGGEMDPPQEGPVPIRMPFRALYDSIDGTMAYLNMTASP